jgi:hypothetical protein
VDTQEVEVRISELEDEVRALSLKTEKLREELRALATLIDQGGVPA